MNVPLLTDLASRGVCLRDAEHVARAHDAYGKGCCASISLVFIEVPDRPRPVMLVLTTARNGSSAGTLAICNVVANETLLQIAGDVDFTAIFDGQPLLKPFTLPSNLSDLIAAAVAKATATPDQQ